MTVPLNDPARLFRLFEREIADAVLAALRSGWWLNGPSGKAFAAAFSRYQGMRFCLPVANGTDALELAMRALSDGQDERREVVTVANAGGYTTVACRNAGLVPVYVDIDEATQLIDAQSLLEALGERTVLVVVTHLYGGVADVPTLRRLMDDAGYSHVRIIEDCAQAHGARIADRLVGSFGDVAAFSFYPTKNLGAAGDAGAIVTDDADLHDRMARLSQYGWRQKYHVDVAGGSNSRMDEIQASYLSVLLPHLDELNRRRRQIAERYWTAAKGGPLRFVEPRDGAVIHLTVGLIEDRSAFRKHMEAHGISTDVHYPVPDCDQPGWRNLFQRIAPSGLDVTRRSSRQVVTIPCFPTMNEQEVDAVIGALGSWPT